MAKVLPGPIELGDRIRDRITGFEGIAICLSLWIDGCRRWLIQPEKLHDGKSIMPENADEGQCVLLAKAVVPKPNFSEPTGGPHPTPPRIGR